MGSAIRTGRAPRVLRAVRFVPLRRAQTLRPIKLRGETPIDPRDHQANFFRSLIEERSKLANKANTAAYGIYAEMNRDERPRT